MLIVVFVNIIVLRIEIRVKKYFYRLLKFFKVIFIYLDFEIFFDFGDKVVVIFIIDRGFFSIVYNFFIFSYFFGILFFLDYMGYYIFRVILGRGMNFMGFKIWRDWKIKKVLLYKKEEKIIYGLIIGMVYNIDL